MKTTRKGYFTITKPDGELLTKSDGSTRQATTRDDCYEYITEDWETTGYPKSLYVVNTPPWEVEVPVINIPGQTIPEKNVVNPFTIGNASNLPVSTVVTSSVYVVSGINVPVDFTITGTAATKERRINGGPWLSTDTTINNGDTWEVRATASGSAATATTFILTIGTTTDTATLTTAVSSEVLFSDSFDSQTDWDISQIPAILPTGYVFAYDSNNMTVGESLYINGDHVITGTKSLTAWYEKWQFGGYSRDGWLAIDITPTDQVYVKFDLMFDPAWSQSTNDSMKLFRILSFDGPPGLRQKFTSSGDSCPMYLFDWAHSDFGVRHKHSFRSDPQESAYTTPKYGDQSKNYTSDLPVASRGVLADQTGGFLPSSGVVEHNQVYGTVKHKVEFFVVLNSAPGVADGIFKYWLDDVLCYDLSDVQWIATGGSMTAQWNSIAWGGNDKTASWVDGQSQWCSFDDIEVKLNHPH